MSPAVEQNDSTHAATSPSNNWREPQGPLPEHQFAVWLMRTAVKRTRDFIQSLIIGPQYQRLARFSADMQTCMRSGIDAAGAMELCLRPHAASRLGQCWALAPDRVRAGGTLADSLRPGERWLPPFYLNIVHAGETSGRTDDAFQFLASHCKLLAGPASSIRKLWLYPLCIVLAGSVVKAVLYFVLGSWGEAVAIAFSELASILKLAILVAFVALTPLRGLVDQLRLTLPWIGDLEHDVAVNRFFRVMTLLYETGDSRVDAMIRIAAQSVTNHAARQDLEKAAAAIEQKATISEAFARVTLLSPHEKGVIDVGEVAGSLERAFDQIAGEAESTMMAKLAILQPLLNRLVMVAVAFSIISAMLGLLM